MDDLDEQARRWGIERGYHDVFGNWHAASDAVVRKVQEAISEGRSGPNFPTHSTDCDRAYQGDGSKIWGLAIQLYAVRSARNWGIGDFGDLQDVIAVAARAGASAVGVNPLHALFFDRPDMASPYAPNSRFFLNPLYIALDDLPDFKDTADFAERRNQLREQPLVDYAGVAALKLAAFQRAYERFLARGSAKRKADWAAFKAELGQRLQRFACFEVLRKRYGPTPWWDWPEPWRNPDQPAIEELHRSKAHACGFIEYLQWVASRQVAACRDDARRLKMPVGLYLDLAVGVDPAGADAWSSQQTVMAGLSVGAPPDEFNPTGQNWGLAPFNPHALPDNDFAALRELLAAAMRYAGAVRLDHVLGLMRLFLIPSGADADQGVYVRYPFEALLAVVAQESNKYHCLFIGEDLGTVPEGFRETAGRWGVWTYRLMMFERTETGEFKPPSEYPSEALTAFNTHDLASFRGWINGHDLQVKRRIGLDPGETDETRAHARDALLQRLGPFAGPNDVSNFAAAAGFLAATNSRLVMVAIDDLLDVEHQINIPGTVDQHPNWRHVLPIPLEQWAEQPTFRAAKAAFDYTGRGRYA